MAELNWVEIAARIKASRKRSKITIEKLSEEIDVSASFIGLVERGDCKIGIDNLFKLASALGVSVDYLLVGDERQNESESRFYKTVMALSDYSDEELELVLDLAKIIRARSVIGG